MKDFLENWTVKVILNIKDSAFLWNSSLSCAVKEAEMLDSVYALCFL